MCENEIECEILKSNRGTPKLYIDGYTYEKNRSTNSASYWTCEKRRKTQCRGTVITKSNELGKHILTKKSRKHNHPKDPLRKKIADFKEKLKEGVAAGINPSDLINDTQADAAFEVIEHLPSTTALRQIIYRQRSKRKDTNFEEIFVSNKAMKSRNVNSAQMKQLLDLLGEDGVMEDGKVVYNNTTKVDFWKRVAFHLNSIEGGPHKNAWQWCKFWIDWKNSTQKKASALLKQNTYNLLDQPMNNLDIDSLEMQLLKLIGYPLDGQDDFLKLEMMQVTKTEAPDIEDQDATEAYLMEFGLGSDKEASDGEENNFEEDFEANHNDDEVDDDKSYDIPVDMESEESDEDRKRRRNKKVSGHKPRKKKLSLQGYRLKVQIELEKERQEQKKEELRLRAIELKLKGDELRLKEMEMNKVKYLTNIEEEKLKCFREISSSLKEFLEMARSGNMRLHI